MKKYIIKPGIRGMFSVDKENGDLDIVDYLGTDIDWVYRVPEDGTLKIQLRNNEINTYDVKEGDIVILFYLEEYTKNPIVIITNKEWRENIEAKEAYRKEQELKRANNDSPCCKCDCCKRTA